MNEKKWRKARNRREKKIKSAHEFFPFCLMCCRLSASGRVFPFFLHLVRFSLSHARCRHNFNDIVTDPPILRSFCFHVCKPMRANIWMNLFQFILVVRRVEMLHAMSSNVLTHESYLCEGIRWSASVCYSLAFHCSCSVSIVDRMRLHAYSMWECMRV